MIAEMLARLWPSKLPPPLISSFLPEALAAARACTPGIALGVLFRAIPKNWRTLAERLGCKTIHADHRSISAARAAEILRSGYALLAYTVNEPRRASVLFDWGVTSVFSDVPHRLQGALVLGGSRQPAGSDTHSVGMPRRGSA